MTAPVMTLIVAAGSPTPGALRSLEAMRRATAGEPTEIMVATNSVWPEMPGGVKVVLCNSASRGDRLDQAARLARASVIAFVDVRTRLTADWQERALALLARPTVAVVGGPILPRCVNLGQRVVATVMSSHAGGPGRYLSRPFRERLVSEISSSNLAIKRTAFNAVGGFQSPSPAGEAVRLCYKVRTILRLGVLYHPDLAVESAPPGLAAPFFASILGLGRARGDLARRLPETSPLLPYGLPSLALTMMTVVMATAAVLPKARVVLLALGAAYVAEAMVVFQQAGPVMARALASVFFPIAPILYAAGFIRGYAGSSLGEVSPRRLRSRPLRVLIFNWRDVAHPWAGGAEAYMHEIGRRWAQAGWEVGWVSGRFRGARQIEVIDGVRIHRVGGRLTLYGFAALAYLLRLRGRYDLIVDCENGVPFFTPLYARLPVILVVHHVHQEVFRRELPRYLRWLALWLEGWLMPRVYRRARVVAVSPSTRAGLLDMGFSASRIAIVSNGVEPVVPQRSARDHRRAPSILYLGRLKPYKSIDVLIRAMPTLREWFPDARLDIVGQGPDRRRLERLSWSLGLAATVHFHGYLPAEDRDRLAARAWVAACPSSFEGWGIACLEANARGLPVIASRVPGLRDAVIDGVTGVLVPHGDVDALVTAVIDLLQDPLRREQMGRAGRAWASEHSWGRSATAFADIVGDVVRIPRPAAAAAALPSLVEREEVRLANGV